MLFDDLTHLLDPDPHRGGLNMAIDEILLRCATRPLLRVYRWARPAVSFGYFGHYDAVAARSPAEELVRRWTGGGEVLHGDGRDCTYTLIIPRAHPFARIRPLESYRALHQALTLLVTAGCLAEAAHPKISDACFDNPAQFDLIMDRQKVAGAAQRRTVHGLLHQGSIIHRAAAATPDFAARLAGVLAARCFEEPISDETLAAAHQLETSKYGTDAWLRGVAAGRAGAKESLAQ
jgi:lipoate-protein ligase A